MQAQLSPQLFNPLTPRHRQAPSQKHIVWSTATASSLLKLCSTRAEAAGSCGATWLSQTDRPARDEINGRCLLPITLSVSASLLCVAAEPGEEVADEHLLHGGVSRQLPAVRVVVLVRVLADVRAGG